MKHVHLLAVSAALLLAACQPAPPPSNTHLSAVDYWPEGRLLFVAQPLWGFVDVLRVPAGARQGSFDFVERLSEPGRRTIVRIAVDRVNRRLWVADPLGVTVHPLAERGHSTRIGHGPLGTPILTDLVIDADGNAYMFLGGGEQIVRISASTLKTEAWVTVGHPGPYTSRIAAGRALMAKDGHHVIFRSPADGTLLQLDLATRQLAKIERREIDAFDCASLFWNDANAIVAIPCRGEFLGEIALDQPEVRRSAESSFRSAL